MILNKQRLFAEYALPVVILGLSIAGARLQNIWLLYAMLILVCVFVGLVALNKVREKTYPLAIFAIGLSLLYQTTLIGPGLVGTDIHGEYYVYYKALSGWDTSIPHPYNTSIGSTVLAPFLTNAFNISGYWIYKAVFPFLFAFVPVLLYFIFKKEFGAKISFLSTFFFVAMLSWSLEMISLPRQMLAELMFATILFLIITSRMALKYRVPLLISCSILGMMFHYVTGPIILFYTGCALILLIFYRRRTFPLKWLGLVVIVLIITFVGYFSNVASGEGFNNVVSTATGRIEAISPFTPVETTPPSTSTSEPGKTSPATVVPATNYLEKQERLVKTALGMDFMDASPLGKLFRIFQFLTQLCIILGCIYFVRNRKQISAEYLTFVVASVFIILACLFWPRLSAIVNVTRLYHLSLFLLAPACILGGLFIFRKPQVLALCLLIPYFLFTSGIIFEVTKQEDISTVDIPYSIALSHQRVDITEIPTVNDIAVRDWAVSQNLGQMLADVHGRLLFCEKVWFDWELGTQEFYPKQEFYYKLESNIFKQGDFIFLSEKNSTTKTLTFIPIKDGIVTSGTRASYSFAELGVEEVIASSKVIYRQGDSVILEIQ